MGRFVVFEGAIGVGKTSLALHYAEWSGARTMLESADENPFLLRFYQEPKRYAFQVQMFFLLTRYRQQKEAQQGELFSGDLVADHSFEKDRIFASLNLDEHELRLYNSLASLLRKDIPPPDIVVLLQAKPEVLLRRIRKRGRDFEKKVEMSYMEALCETYNHFFFHYADAPVMVVDTTDLDLEAAADQREDLFRRIDKHRAGMMYYHFSSEQ
jgi:deoxyadenosine/deoxycytidine kinase